MKKLFSIVVLLSSALASTAFAANDSRLGPKDERQAAYNVRVLAAATETVLRPAYYLPDETNGDETNVPNFAAQFTKLFTHDAVTSVPDTAGQLNYQRLVKAELSGLQADFNAMQRTAGTQRKFANPQSGCAFSMEGADSDLIPMPLAPTLTSAQAAAEILEVYWKMICRDVNFNDYGTGLNTDNDGFGASITNKAAAVLDDLGAAYQGPRNGSGHVDATVLFRNSAPGALVGPFVSQFMLQPLLPPFPAGCLGPVATLMGVQNLPIAQVFTTKQLYPIAAKREFGVSWADFIAIQNGFIPKQYAFSDYNSVSTRYVINGRDGGSYVHFDGPYSPYYNALIILATNGFPLNPNSPYANGAITNEGALHTMGGSDAFALVGAVSVEAFKAAWAHKWRGQRRLRPEAMAGLVHFAKTTSTNPYGLHSSIFALHNSIDTLAQVLAHNQLQAQSAYDPQQLLTLNQASTYLLAQMFPEGSPEHPSWPAGHATVGGACTTVIKAIFNDQALINSKLTPSKPNPADPTQLIPLLPQEGSNTMTVGSELDKLASSVAGFRDFAGVHYRGDGDQGLLLGEQVGIQYLQDHCRIYQEQGFTGFTITKRDGTRILITADAVTNI